MSELLAMSFDVDTAPSIHLGDAPAEREGPHHPYGWGMAWYAPGELVTTVVRDPTSTGDNAMSTVLRDWDHFRSTVFVCHLKGAAQRLTLRDTQPFVRAQGGREWLFAHNGDVDAEALPQASAPPFEPLGNTDSERLFAWLMAGVSGAGAERLADIDPELVHTWMTTIDHRGTANLILSDGEDLIVHRDDEGFNGLCWLRMVPPHETTRLESSEVIIDLDAPTDHNRTGVIVSTRPLSSDDGWTDLEPGQTMVVRRGDIVWSSAPETTAPRHRDGRPVRLPRFRRALDPAGWRTLEVRHRTSYTYEEPVERSSHAIRLRPVIDDHQEVLEHDLLVNVDGEQRDYDDVFGNRATNLELGDPYDSLVVEAVSTVRVRARTPLEQLRGFSRRLTVPPRWMPWQRQMQAPYLLPAELPETQLRALTDYAESFVQRNGGDLFDVIDDMTRTIYRDFDYVPGFTTLETTPFDVFDHRKGVCQDFANLLICLARLLDVPARYRVGYIYTGGDYENRIQSDASHAWAEVYFPWVGWRGFDPTNGVQVGVDHVRVAAGRNYRDATPTAGTIWRGGAGERLTIDVQVVDPLVEDDETSPSLPGLEAPPRQTQLQPQRQQRQ